MATEHFWHGWAEFYFHPPKAPHERARLDADGTAKPKTRIIDHPKQGDCVGPGMALKDPELENLETGERTSLVPIPEQERCSVCEFRNCQC
jgi:hypothetical protein